MVADRDNRLGVEAAVAALELALATGDDVGIEQALQTLQVCACART